LQLRHPKKIPATRLVLDGCDADGFGAVREAVLETFAPRRDGEGYRLQNLFRVLDARPAPTPT